METEKYFIKNRIDGRYLYLQDYGIIGRLGKFGATIFTKQEADQIIKTLKFPENAILVPVDSLQ